MTLCGTLSGKEEIGAAQGTLLHERERKGQSTHDCCLWNVGAGVGELAHQIRALAALGEDLGSIPGAWHFTAVCDFSSRRSDVPTQI